MTVAASEPKPAPAHALDAGKLIVHQHSDLLYWWVVWAYGLFCALLTRLQGVPVSLSPNHKAVLVHPSAWVGISFVEGDALVLGPWAGVERLPDEPPPVRVPIAYGGSRVAELGVDAPEPDVDERAFLERVAVLVSAHCLVGWDTGGMTWSELGG